MYKLASLMTSELGRAYDTLKTKPLPGVRAGKWPKHRGRELNSGVRKSQSMVGEHTDTHHPWGPGDEAAASTVFLPGPYFSMRTLFLFYKKSD